MKLSINIMVEKILFIIRRYATTDGASQGLFNYIKSNPAIKSYLIITRWIISSQDNLNIIEVVSWKDIQQILSEYKFDIIHYFKTAYYDIFNWTIKAERSLNLNIPIVTTVCQRPSTKGLLLSPKEIRSSESVVLIDKSAYNDNLIAFIPYSKKKKIYFGTTDRIICRTGELVELKKQSKRITSKIVFGRGSTLSKCPPDMISVYRQIKYPEKKFVIAGISPDSWIEKAIEGEEDIEIVGINPFDEWLEICNEFDVFLYYLPKSSHSSIDGTLGQAMLLEKAVVYFGPDAPKERLIDGENALIAECVEDIPKLCDELATNVSLREKLGKRARETTIENFSIYSAVEKYNTLYKEVMEGEHTSIRIPITYYMNYYRSCWKHIIKSFLGGSFIESLHFRRHPLI